PQNATRDGTADADAGAGLRASRFGLRPRTKAAPANAWRARCPGLTQSDLRHETCHKYAPAQAVVTSTERPTGCALGARTLRLPEDRMLKGRFGPRTSPGATTSAAVGATSRSASSSTLRSRAQATRKPSCSSTSGSPIASSEPGSAAF